MEQFNIDTTFTPLLWVSLSGLLLSCILLIRFYMLYYKPLCKYPLSSQEKTSEEIGISVVFSGKDQYAHLSRNLPFWLNQLYSKFEILVVYDSRDEELHLLLSSLESKNPRLVLIHVNQSINFLNEQKFSLSIGIKSAKFDHVLLTTADCRPQSEYCLSTIASGLTQEVQVAAGYCLHSTAHSSAFARYFYNDVSLQTLGFILAGKPYSASHQALIYHKDLFLKHLGYTDYYALNTGPYDIFYRHLSSPKGAYILNDPKSTLRVETTLTFKRWIGLYRQYLNAYSGYRSAAGKECKIYHISIVAFHLFTWAGLIYAGITSTSSFSLMHSLWFYLLLLLYFTKTLWQIGIAYSTHQKLGEKNLWWRTPFFEFGFAWLLPSLWIGRKKRKSL